VADGTILVELTGPALVRKNRAIINGGDGHQITVFAYWSQDADGSVARKRIRRTVAERTASEGFKDIVAPGFADEARAMMDRGGIDLLARELPDAWLDEIAVAGTPCECLAAIDRLGEAGAVRVALVPPADATIEQLTTWCRDLAAVAGRT
jgi:hypothetical protein